MAMTVIMPVALIQSYAVVEIRFNPTDPAWYSTRTMNDRTGVSTKSVQAEESFSNASELHAIKITCASNV